MYLLFTGFGSPNTSARDTKKPDTSLENKSSTDSIPKYDAGSTESLERVSDEEVKRIASCSIYSLFIYVLTLVIKSEERRKFIIMVLVGYKVIEIVEFE